jgi:hypothetical protein
MNEELKVMEEQTNYEATEAEYYEEPVKTGNGVIVKEIAIGAVAAVVGVGAFIYYKTKDKREQRTIRKLEKKGYVISKQIDVVEESEPVSEQNEEVQEEK